MKSQVDPLFRIMTLSTEDYFKTSFYLLLFFVVIYLLFPIFAELFQSERDDIQVTFFETVWSQATIPTIIYTFTVMYKSGHLELSPPVC